MKGLVWIGKDGLLKVPGIICLALCLASILFCFTSYTLWVKYMNRARFASIKAELDEHEAEWKAERLQEVLGATPVSSQSLGDGENSVTLKSSVGAVADKTNMNFDPLTPQMSAALFKAVRSRSKLGEEMREAEVAKEMLCAQEQTDAKQAAWFCKLATLSKSFSDLNGLLEIQSKESSGNFGRRRQSVKSAASVKSIASRSASTLANVSEVADEAPCDETEDFDEDLAQVSPPTSDALGSRPSPQLNPPMHDSPVITPPVDVWGESSPAHDRVGVEQPANLPEAFTIRAQLWRTSTRNLEEAPDFTDLGDDAHGSAPAALAIGTLKSVHSLSSEGFLARTSITMLPRPDEYDFGEDSMRNSARMCNACNPGLPTFCQAR